MTVTLSSIGDKVRCLFADTGSGISEEIVDAMVGAAAEWNKAEEESGRNRENMKDKSRHAKPHIMGLRIAGQMAAAHGGRLRFASRKSGGYDAVLELPNVVSENNSKGKRAEILQNYKYN